MRLWPSGWSAPRVRLAAFVREVPILIVVRGGAVHAGVHNLRREAPGYAQVPLGAATAAHLVEGIFHVLDCLVKYAALLEETLQGLVLLHHLVQYDLEGLQIPKQRAQAVTNCGPLSPRITHLLDGALLRFKVLDLRRQLFLLGLPPVQLCGRATARLASVIVVLHPP